MSPPSFAHSTFAATTASKSRSVLFARGLHIRHGRELAQANVVTATHADDLGEGALSARLSSLYALVASQSVFHHSACGATGLFAGFLAAGFFAGFLGFAAGFAAGWDERVSTARVTASLICAITSGDNFMSATFLPHEAGRTKNHPHAGDEDEQGDVSPARESRVRLTRCACMTLLRRRIITSRA